MSLSLIISIYKRLDFLDLIFQSLENQWFKDFEVIVAEDANDNNAMKFLEEARLKFSYAIKHVSQEDMGFRKNRILNRAVKKSSFDKLVFIDGDCLLHPGFLLAYQNGLTSNIVKAGRRVELSESHTNRMLKRNKLIALNPLGLLLNQCKYPEKTFYLPWVKALNSGDKHLLGCNWGILKKDLYAINGFDEDYERAGVGEDSDVEWRLKAAGISIISHVHSAIQYHLHHPIHYSQKSLKLNYEMMNFKKSRGLFFCKNGLDS